MFTSTELLEKINCHIAGLNLARTPRRLYEPVSYVLSLGGKRIRPLLMLMAYNLWRDDVESIFAPATGIEVYHNYTLLHDDLMDKADRRRGKPTVHKVWNENTAILSGDAMLVLAYQFMAQCPAPYLKEVVDLFSQTALEICEGQQLDMDFETRTDVTPDEYIEMIRLKTSVLLACSLKMGAILAGASETDAELLYRFGINLGVAFQLKDDLLDVYGNPEVFGKNIGGDILCNKKTYLLIKALEAATPEQRRKLEQWLNTPTYNPAEKITSVTALYNEIGVKSTCEALMSEYTQRAHTALESLSIPDERRQPLADLLEQLMYRNK